jgi:serine phosphatase RsbU (regulator of sigma subunit)
VQGSLDIMSLASIFERADLLPFAPTGGSAVTPVGRAVDLPLRSALRIASKQSARFGAGGDFFEVFEHADGRVSTVVADVCGNGAAAAKVAARIRPLLHLNLIRGESPARVLAALNDALMNEGLGERFVTAVAVRVDVRAGVAEIACAGHLGPFMLPASGDDARMVCRASGVPLGLVAGEVYEEISVRLDPDDALVLVTDGVTDPLSSKGDPLGEAAFSRRLENVPRRSVGICEAVLSGPPRRDDATVLVMQLPRAEAMAMPIAA